jgi:predicted ATP-grasp superfamily ATP-dependent carboligase
MNDLIQLWEIPAPGKYLVAGWHQWADAGEVSSGLPQYLIEHTRARKIGEIEPGDFYLFQIPGTHHLLRPVIRLEEGLPRELEQKRNEFFYAGDGEQGFFIFLGQEPHQNEKEYADVFFEAIKALGIKRVAVPAGVFGAVPYDKDRNISCVYSLPQMKDELDRYTVKFSGYEGGATISMYLAHRAESRRVEFFRLCAFVPSYDFSQASTLVHPIAIDQDFKAWYDIMTRLEHMFDLNIDLSDLERRSDKLVSEWHAKIEQLAMKMPQLGVKDLIDQVNKEFTEMSFEPLSDVWEEALGDLFDDF